MVKGEGGDQISFRSEGGEIDGEGTDLRDVDRLVELAGADVLGGGVLILGELDVARRVAAGGVLCHGRHRLTDYPRSTRRRRRRPSQIFLFFFLENEVRSSY